MPKINMAEIVSSVQKLYAKDKKKDVVFAGDALKVSYTEKDGIPLPGGHPLNDLLGLPVLPYNKILQTAGKPDTGKSTLAAEVMVAAQKSGHQVVVLDSEDKFDAARFKNYFGGNPKDIALIKTNETRRGGEAIRKIVTAIKEADMAAKILVVWDSVGGSQSRAHAERELDDERHAQPGQDAKENGEVMKMLVALINKYPDSISVYLANQTYAKIGFMQKGDAITGGSKVEYFSSFIITLKRIKVLTKVIKGKEVKTGIITRATVYKNHLASGETSTHKLDFEIAARGSRLLDKMVENKEEDDDEEGV